MTGSHDQQISYGFFVLLSFLIWLIATLILRLWGHTFFIPSNSLLMSLNFLWSLSFWPLIVYGIFRWQKVQPQQRRDVAICLAIPGMLLDVLTTYFFAQVFPNMSPWADGPYGAWLLWGYAILLLTGVITSQSGLRKHV
ncbi:DUF5367 domain-containing protein [Iningainema tapete]|uniref:DUF5367 domain-containing protein n=1 Tax=Iningainema tapete BLCC-T55 TaxID=2748662 RepID=A0A8J6XMV8_9CYAN|nr:DUF5367 domain-containing protein [Iningainema tapete]MBD2773931.1 DUF5367 domain-containing protein [Iningainema tapete BLCC-T55]